jgi:hypothetical protein
MYGCVQVFTDAPRELHSLHLTRRHADTRHRPSAPLPAILAAGSNDSDLAPEALLPAARACCDAPAAALRTMAAAAAAALLPTASAAAELGRLSAALPRGPPAGSLVHVRLCIWPETGHLHHSVKHAATRLHDHVGARLHLRPCTAGLGTHIMMLLWPHMQIVAS